MAINYKKFIETRLKIVSKAGEVVPFVLNDAQVRFMDSVAGQDDKICVLKARQMGFSSLILAMFTVDFILEENSRSVIVADISNNAMELLDRVKGFIKSYEDITGAKIPLKYNSRYELFNESINSRYIIGTADNRDFGRSKTITNLHLSEFAFYPDAEKLFAGVMQAVVPNGRVIIETTANGFNYFKEFWDRCERGETSFKPLFFKASDFYSQEFLANKQQELGRMYSQEYPESSAEAFLSSGETYFDKDALKYYMDNIKKPERVSEYV